MSLQTSECDVPFLSQAKEEELKEKRMLLLSKNHTLDSLASTPQSTTVDTFQLEPTDPLDLEEGISYADVIDDIMELNEEVEALDDHVTILRKQLKTVSEIASHAQFEDIGEEDEYNVATDLALKLTSKYQLFKSLEIKVFDLVTSLESLRKEHSLSTTPLQYMLHLPPHPSAQKGEGQGVWLHTLPDQLTGKTNCEMRVELCLLEEMVKYAEELQQR